jgi:hypothetical protein
VNDVCPPERAMEGRRCRTVNGYARILGITDPWRVERVDMKLKIGAVHIIGHPPDLGWPCPGCGVLCALPNHQPERQWRHPCSHGELLLL